jgi:hypothetical protein
MKHAVVKLSRAVLGKLGWRLYPRRLKLKLVECKRFLQVSSAKTDVSSKPFSQCLSLIGGQCVALQAPAPMLSAVAHARISIRLRNV